MVDYMVVDDFIPVSYQEEIKNLLLDGMTFPWYFNADLTYGSLADQEKTPGNAHVFRRDFQTNSPHYPMLAPLAHLAAERFGRKYNDVSYCRTFLQFPLNVAMKTTPLHIDTVVPHYVLLYYVNDSDAETIIVDKTYEWESNKDAEFNLSVEDHDILMKVKPKQGRALIFDGKYYHAHEIVKSGVRCAINFNIM